MELLQQPAVMHTTAAAAAAAGAALLQPGKLLQQHGHSGLHAARCLLPQRLLLQPLLLAGCAAEEVRLRLRSASRHRGRRRPLEGLWALLIQLLQQSAPQRRDVGCAGGRRCCCGGVCALRQQQCCWEVIGGPHGTGQAVICCDLEPVLPVAGWQRLVRAIAGRHRHHGGQLLQRCHTRPGTPPGTSHGHTMGGAAAAWE
jgi:hypothetical protein